MILAQWKKWNEHRWKFFFCLPKVGELMGIF